MIVMTGPIKRTITEGEGEAERKITFEFRQPTEIEINKFLSSRYPADKKRGMRDQSAEARSAFFDMLLTGIEDTGQPALTLADKGLINPVVKGAIIFEIFEDTPEISEKN